MPAKRKRDDTDTDTGKFGVTFENNECVINGRPEFGSAAKKIKLNDGEHRRHMLHYDEELKPRIQSILTNLLASSQGDKPRVATKIIQAMKRRGIKNIRGQDIASVAERLVKEMNGVVDNLVPGPGDTNNAIELARGYLRKGLAKLENNSEFRLHSAGFATDDTADQTATTPTATTSTAPTPTAPKLTATDQEKKLKGYKALVTEALEPDSTGTGIIEERDRILAECREMVGKCETPGQLWELLRDLTVSVTFDLSPKTRPITTEKALAWQRKMSRVEDASAEDQLEELVSLLG